MQFKGDKVFNLWDYFSIKLIFQNEGEKFLCQEWVG